jgi:integrase
MRSGPTSKGPRLWLQPGRNRSGKPEPSIWVVRDGSHKRSTGCRETEIAQAERFLADYIAEKYQPAKGSGDPSQVPIADILALYAEDVVPGHARPKDTMARITRMLGWWGDPESAAKEMRTRKVRHIPMTGMLTDVKTAACQAYLGFVKASRSGRMDLELLRAAINHAYREQMVDRPVAVWLPPKAPPRERWLTRSEVAKLVWTAWRSRRTQDSGSDDWAMRKHLARWMLTAAYTGTRKSAILNAGFERAFGRGYVDLQQGVWHRRGQGVRATKKRQPPIPLPAPLLAHMKRWRRNGQSFVVEFNGQPMQRMDKAFRQLVAECGLDGEKVVPHTFRHTAITWAMLNGMEPYAAAGYFGLNLQTLLENYGHYHPNHLREAAEAMARPRKIG